jgi:peptide/nickel transport system permease protein
MKLDPRRSFAVVWLGLAVVLTTFAPRLSSHAVGQPVGVPLAPASSSLPFGGDELGRDLWARLLYGGRASLGASVLAAGVTVALGSLVGLLAALGGRWVHGLIVLLVNAALAIPGLLLALLLVAGLGPGFPTIVLAVGLGGVAGFARLARQAFLQGQTASYIAAASALGAGRTRVALAHLIPNARPQLVPLAATYYAWSLLGTTTLTFLGLGGDPTNPEWGSMLNAGRLYLQEAPHLVLLPGLAIALTILSVHSLAGALARGRPSWG